MFELDNRTNLSAGLYPGWNIERKFQMTLVTKLTYNFNHQGQLTLANNQANIIDVDQYRDTPFNSSLIKVNETAAYKKGGELYCYSTAYPVNDKTQVMEVGLGILFTDKSEWKKVLRIYGKRTWKKSVLNYTISKTDIISKPIPIIYENSYGGQETENQLHEWPLNPIGRGYNFKSSSLISDELAAIEIGPNFITSPTQSTVPAGFAPLSIFWEPRASAIGSLLESKNFSQGSPYGEDALETVHHVAPEDQWFPKPFSGGEIIYLRGLVKDVPHQKTVKLAIPKVNFDCYASINGGAEWLTPVCDTLVLNTDTCQLSLIYRAGIPCDFYDTSLGYIVLESKKEHVIDAINE